MYVALRSMKVQGDDGVVRQVKPGDNVPEAASWSNVGAYVKRRWIEKEGELCVKCSAELPAVVAAPVVAEESAPVETPIPSGDASDPKLSEEELKGMSKGSLQALAEDLSIDPDQVKAKLVEAILEEQ